MSRSAARWWVARRFSRSTMPGSSSATNLATAGRTTSPNDGHRDAASDAGGYHRLMQTTLPPAQDIVTWDVLDELVAGLAERLRGEEFDLLLAITRGGLVPAGMLAYRLGMRNILVAAVEYYDDEGQPGPRPTFLQFPADPQLRGQRILVVDEVWDSGTTIHAVTERIRQAGGIPTTVVLHFTTTDSAVPGAPDIHAVTTDAWVVYPFKAGG